MSNSHNPFRLYNAIKVNKSLITPKRGETVVSTVYTSSVMHVPTVMYESTLIQNITLRNIDTRFKMRYVRCNRGCKVKHNVTAKYLTR